MSVPFILNVGGVWIPLHGVQRDTPRTRTRARSDFLSLGGRRYVQFGDRASRTWKLDYAAKDPAAVKWLAEAAAGRAGVVWLLDRAAAQVNMLDPNTTAGRYNAQPSIATELGIPSQTFAAGRVFSRRVRAGQTYHLSGWTSVAAGDQIGVLGFDGGTTLVLAPGGAGSRLWSTSFAPQADGIVTFDTAVAGKTTRLRLTEGSVDEMGFYPGQDTPCQVAVSDPDDVLSLYRPDRPSMANYSVELTEVG